MSATAKTLSDGVATGENSGSSVYRVPPPPPPPPPPQQYARSFTDGVTSSDSWGGRDSFVRQRVDGVTAGESSTSITARVYYKHDDAMTRDVWGWTYLRAFDDSVLVSDALSILTARQVLLTDNVVSVDQRNSGHTFEDTLHEIDVEFEGYRYTTQVSTRFAEKSRKLISRTLNDALTVSDALYVVRMLADISVAGMKMVYVTQVGLLDSVLTTDVPVVATERRIGVTSAMTEGELQSSWKQGAPQEGTYRVIEGVTVERYGTADMVVGRFKMRGE